MDVKKYSLFKNSKFNIYIEEMALMLILACILFLGIKEKMTIHVASDEFGYWTAASNFLGWNWSNSASLNTYYSFGYGAVLAVLLLLFKESVLAYKAALIINIVFILIAYLLWQKIFTRLCPEQKRSMIILLSFCVSCYTCNYVNTKLTLSECFLWFLFSLLTWTLQQFVIFKKVKWLLLSYIISAYMFMVHMRTIVILCALIIFTFGFCISNFGKKKTILYGLLFIFFVIAAVFMEEFFKNQLITMQYTSSQTLSVNDVGGQVNKVRHLFSVEGIKQFVLNVCGRFYYLGYSTVLLIYFGLLFFIKKILALFETKDKNDIWIYIFMLMSFTLALAISALYMGIVKGARTDVLFYGRYSEYVIVPILFFGIIEFLENVHRIKLFFTFFIIQTMLSILVIKTITYYEMRSLLDVSIPALFYLLRKNDNEISAYWLSVIVIALIVFLVCFITKNHNTRNFQIAVFVICLFFAYSGYMAYQISDMHKHDEGYIEAYESVKSNSLDEENVFYCYDNNDFGTYSHMIIDIIQFSMREKVIKFKNVEDYNNIPMESIIITRSDSKCFDVVSYQPLEIFRNDEFTIYKKIEGEGRR